MLETDSRVIPGWVYSVYSQFLPCSTLSTNSRRNACYVGHKIRGNPGLENTFHKEGSGSWATSPIPTAALGLSLFTALVLTTQFCYRIKDIERIFEHLDTES